MKITVREASLEFKISRYTIHDWIKRGKLLVTKNPNARGNLPRVHIERDDFTKLLASLWAQSKTRGEFIFCEVCKLKKCREVGEKKFKCKRCTLDGFGPLVAKADINRHAVLKYKQKNGCVGFLGDPCPILNPRPEVLQFDHVRGVKSFEICVGVSSGMPLEKLFTEIKKCDIRCPYCHNLKTLYDLRVKKLKKDRDALFKALKNYPIDPSLDGAERKCPICSLMSLLIETRRDGEVVCCEWYCASCNLGGDIVDAIRLVDKLSALEVSKKIFKMVFPDHPEEWIEEDFNE